MRNRLYNFIKSPADGKPETTLYDYFMMIVIIVSLFPLTYKPDAEPYWIYYIEHAAIAVVALPSGIITAGYMKVLDEEENNDAKDILL